MTQSEIIEMESWFALESAVAQLPSSCGPTYEYGRRLYGGCLEEGYREQTTRWMTECPECHRWRCSRADFERADGGALNFYYREDCDACGYYETDYSDDY